MTTAANNNNNNKVQVKGCGCRYRDQEGYEYLCDTHRNEFILKLYNNQNSMKEYLKVKDKIDKEMLKSYYLDS